MHVLKDHYLLQVAKNGAKALEITSGEPKPDLILLDIMMPGMSGYEVCQRLKENEETQSIPVIFVTAMTEVEDETHGLELGAVDYITKPISPPIVLARIKNHLLLKNQHDRLKKSISVMEHEAEILKQKAELGIQAGGLAHDINNILAGCTAVEYIPEFLEEGSPGRDKVGEFVDLITANIDLGIDICQGYTSYLQDIGTEPKVQPILPLCQPIDMFSRKFKGEIIKEFAENLPPISCKGYQIKRTILNLFLNGCQAVEEKDAPLITMKAWSEDDRVCLSIGDNGPGIREDHLAKIFDEGFTTQKNGTGLGLSMVKKIVDSHHGTIRVDSSMGEGTVFTLSFPAALPEKKENIVSA